MKEYICSSWIKKLFLTSAAEKTQPQAENSSQKLKEKTQPLGGLSLKCAKLKKKNYNSLKNFLKTQNFQRGGSFYAIFIDKYFQKTEKFRKNCNDIVKILIFF